MPAFHNYIRPHESLNGQTAAEKAGIRIEGQNKWITLNQNAPNENEIENESV